jgi:hypothetical protein
MGAPDEDRDGRPDAADNCPRVWNVNQADDDHDGVGNVCDATPRGAIRRSRGPTAPSRAPSSRGRTRSSAASTAAATRAAPATGAAPASTAAPSTWNVSLSGLRAISRFTYRGCDNTVTVPVHDYMRDPRGTDPMATRMMDVRLVGNGTISQDTNFSGDGTESGTVTLTGDFTGTAVSHIQIRNSAGGRAAISRIACSTDPIDQEMCAPNNLLVNYRFPDWTCEPGGCPMPPSRPRRHRRRRRLRRLRQLPDGGQPHAGQRRLRPRGRRVRQRSPAMTDTDRDGVPDAATTARWPANPTQQDTDRDGVGDACDMGCDPDTDRDGVADAATTARWPPTPCSKTPTCDGQGDACDATPMGVAPFSLLRVKHRALPLRQRRRRALDHGVRRAAAQPAVGGRRRGRRAPGLSQPRVDALPQRRSWAGTIGMAACNTSAAAPAVGAGALRPGRLRRAVSRCGCTARVQLLRLHRRHQRRVRVARQLRPARHENNRKIGIYRGGRLLDARRWPAVASAASGASVARRAADRRITARELTAGRAPPGSAETLARHPRRHVSAAVTGGGVGRRGQTCENRGQRGLARPPQ